MNQELSATIGLLVQSIILLWGLGFVLCCMNEATRKWYIATTGRMIRRSLRAIGSLVAFTTQFVLQSIGEAVQWAWRTDRNICIGVMIGVAIFAAIWLLNS